MIETVIADRALRMRIGHKQDMYFAVLSSGRKDILIQHIFYDMKRCEDYIRRFNYALRSRV